MKRRASGTGKGEKKPKHALQIQNTALIPDGWWSSADLWTLKPVSADRVTGGVRGAIMGDSLGVPHEFPRWMKCTYTGRCEHKFTVRVGERFGHPPRTLAPGQPSDDGEMLLCILRSLVKHKTYVARDVVEWYIRWAHSDQPSVGTNTRLLFKAISTKTRYDPTGFEHYRSKFAQVTGVDFNTPWTHTSESFQSDGSLMRCLPLAFLPTAQAIQDAVKADVWCSNPSRFVLSIEMIYVWMIRQAAQGESAAVILDTLLTRIVPTLQDAKLREMITEMKETETHVNKGWLVHGFMLSLLVLKRNLDYMSAMKWVIAGFPGSDTDTNACIVGGLLGTLLGWTQMQASDERVAANWKIIVASTAPGSSTQVPRPPEFQLADLATLETELLGVANQT